MQSLSLAALARLGGDIASRVRPNVLGVLS